MRPRLSGSYRGSNGEARRLGSTGLAKHAQRVGFVSVEAAARFLGISPAMVTISRFPGRFECGVGGAPQRLGSSGVFIPPVAVAGL